MKNVNNVNELVEVLSNLDCVEFSQIKINNSTIDLFYDVDINQFVIFDKCDLYFDTLDELENYMSYEYQLN